MTSSEPAAAAAPSSAAPGVGVSSSGKSKAEIKGIRDKIAFESDQLESKLDAKNTAEIRKVIADADAAERIEVQAATTRMMKEIEGKSDHDTEKIMDANTANCAKITERAQDNRRRALEAKKQELAEERTTERAKLASNHRALARGTDIQVETAKAGEAEEKLNTIIEEQISFVKDFSSRYTEDIAAVADADASLTSLNHAMSEIKKSLDSGEAAALEAATARKLAESTVTQEKLDKRSKQLKERLAKRKRAALKVVDKKKGLDEETKEEEIAAIETSFNQQINAVVVEAAAEISQAQVKAVQEAIEETVNDEVTKETLVNGVKDATSNDTKRGAAKSAEVFQIHLQAAQRVHDQSKEATPSKRSKRRTIKRTASVASTVTPEVGEALETIDATEMSKDAQKKLDALKEEHAKRQVRLQLEHQEKLNELQARLKASSAVELQVEIDEVENNLAAEQERLIMERNEMFKLKIEKEKANMSEKELEDMIAGQEARNKVLEAAMDRERESQKAKIKARLEAQKEKKAARFQAEQELELQQELLREKNERERVLAEEHRKAESTVLRRTKTIDRSDVLIYKVIQRRHREETKSLEEHSSKEKEVAVAKALNEFDETAEQRLASMQKEQDREMTRLISEMAEATEEEVAEKKASLNRAHEVALSELKEKLAEQRKIAEKNVAMPMDVELAGKRLALREKQYAEVASAFKEYSPATELTAQYEEAAAAARAKNEEYKEKLAAQKEAHMKKLKDARQNEVDAKRANVAAEVAKLEAEVEEERKAQVRRDANARREAKKLKEAMMKSAYDKMKQDIGEEEDDKKRKLLLQKHSKEMELLSQNLSSEKDRQAKLLKQKLEKKRADRQAKRLKDLHAQADAADADTARVQSELAAVEASVASNASEELAAAARPTTPGRIENEKKKAERAARLAAANADWASGDGGEAFPAGPGEFQGPGGPMTMARRRSTKLSAANAGGAGGLALDRILSKIGDIEHTIAEDVTGKGGGPSYIDTKDAKWLNTAAYSSGNAVEENQLNNEQKAALKFGKALIQTLRQSIPNFPNIDIEVVSEIPKAADAYVRNAYRRSYFYEEGSPKMGEPATLQVRTNPFLYSKSPINFILGFRVSIEPIEPGR